MTVDPLAVTVTVRVEGAPGGAQLRSSIRDHPLTGQGGAAPPWPADVAHALGRREVGRRPGRPLLPGVTVIVGTPQTVRLLRVTLIVTVAWMSCWPLFFTVGRGRADREVRQGADRGVADDERDRGARRGAGVRHDVVGLGRPGALAHGEGEGERVPAGRDHRSWAGVASVGGEGQGRRAADPRVADRDREGDGRRQRSARLGDGARRGRGRRDQAHRWIEDLERDVAGDGPSVGAGREVLVPAVQLPWPDGIVYSKVVAPVETMVSTPRVPTPVRSSSGVPHSPASLTVTSKVTSGIVPPLRTTEAGVADPSVSVADASSADPTNPRVACRRSSSPPCPCGWSSGSSR